MSETTEIVEQPIINCHTHIFTGDHVPPYLARTFLPWPFYKLLNLSWLVALFRFYYRVINPYRYDSKAKTYRQLKYSISSFIHRNLVVRVLYILVSVYLTLAAFFILFEWVSRLSVPNAKIRNLVGLWRANLDNIGIPLIPTSLGMQVSIVIVVLLFIKSGRNLLLFILKKIWGFFKILPGPQTRKLLQRYLNIGRFSFNKEQDENFKRLRNQYPKGTGFVVLPMDMEYMEAGPLKQQFRYQQQMSDLWKIKANPEYEHRIFPFVFVDPRRIEAEPDYFLWESAGPGEVRLKECFVKEYIVRHRFSGFKIYPALGYYPFDHSLLPLWKYAADNGLPIMTHCIRGNIYYRGAKKKEWDYHPIIEQAAGDSLYRPLLLHEMKNIDFINNFTHPLNYLCLLEEELLRKWVAKASHEIQELFGFTNLETKMEYDLSQLKICFGHFGGEDEWNRFIEFDRDNLTSQLIKNPQKGISFLYNPSGEAIPGKLEQVWRDGDWYSIICSMILQYDNLYGDLSYILHDPEIIPLLMHTLKNPKLRARTLFGTDFYVVRNHKSEKHMLAEMQSRLRKEFFDSIARNNPVTFLANSVP